MVCPASSPQPCVVGHGLQGEWAKEEYVKPRAGGYMKETDAPEYARWQQAKKRQKR